jgi:hypothetical protein
MTAALRSEFRKFFSTRLWWVLLAIAFGYMAFTAAAVALAFHFAGAETGIDLSGFGLAEYVYGLGPSGGYVFPLLIGAMSATGEYRHQTITPTFLGEPRRWVVLIAKMLSSTPLGLLYGIGLTAGCVLAGALCLALVGEPTQLGSADTWELIGRCLLAMVLWTVLGVGLGVLLKNQVAAIIVVLAFVSFLEPVIRVIPFATGFDMPWVSYLPGAAGEAISGVSMYAGMVELLPWYGGVGVMAAYGVIFAVAGYFTTFRRDVS